MEIYFNGGSYMIPDLRSSRGASPVAWNYLPLQCTQGTFWPNRERDNYWNPFYIWLFHVAACHPSDSLWVNCAFRNSSLLLLLFLLTT